MTYDSTESSFKSSLTDFGAVSAAQYINFSSPVVFQIYDNAMITAGLNDDPRPMISRLNDLLTKALEKH